MSAAQITPGPWVTAKSNCGYINVTVGSYLYTPRWTGIGHTPEMEANARLIAAAPELYEALFAIIDTVRTSIPMDLTKQSLAALEKAGWQSEFAKARGEQS